MAADDILGAHAAYERMPHFFTDQYDLGLEYVGHVGPCGDDRVVPRGDVPGRAFTAFCLKDGCVPAGMHVNDWDAMEPIRGIVAAGAIDPSALRDNHVPLDQLAS